LLRRAILSFVSVVLAGVGVGVASSPVRAECPFFVIPPATEAASSAREVIVGTVVENVGGRYSDFRLRIDHVLRGRATVGEIRRFDDLWPGWPLAEGEDGTQWGPCEPIRALEGDVIALALDALAPDGVTRYNAESWLSGGLPYTFDEPRTTLAEMTARTRTIAPRTDVEPVSAAGHASPVSPLALTVVFGAAVPLLALWVMRRRKPVR
jgi:hypothetical protein